MELATLLSPGIAVLGVGHRRIELRVDIWGEFCVERGFVVAAFTLTDSGRGTESAVAVACGSSGER